MEARAVIMYDAMTRMRDVVERIPELKARAAECRAYELFLGEIAEFERMLADEKFAKDNRPLLAREVRELVSRIMLELRCVDGAHKLTGEYENVFTSVKPPSKETHVQQFRASVSGYVDAMEQRKEKLVAAGLHPNKFDDVRALLERHLDLHTAWAKADADLKLLPDVTAIWMERARDRGNLLRDELYSAMTRETRNTWDKAASLGRTHGSKALQAGKQLALPAPETRPENQDKVAESPGSVASPEVPSLADAPNQSLGKRTIRRVLRVFGDDHDDASAA